MKNLNDYILELEYKKIDEEWDKYFDIDDSSYIVSEAKHKFGDNSTNKESKGFFGWLKKLGKKFWDWLIGKDFSDKKTDWGTDNGVRWIDTASSKMDDIVKKKDFDEIFPETTKCKNRYEDAVCILGENKNKVPAIITTLIIDEEQVKKLVNKFYGKKSSRYEKYLNKENSICMILCIEVSERNEDDLYHLFDKCISPLFDFNLCKKFDVIFFHPSFVKTRMFKEIDSEFDMTSDNKFPMLLMKTAKEMSADVEPEEEDDNTSEEPTKPKNGEETNNAEEPENTESTEKTDDNSVEINIKKKTPEPESETIPEQKITFTDSSTGQHIATADYTTDEKIIEEITNININKKDYYNFLITELNIDSKYNSDNYEAIISDVIMPAIFDKLAEAIKIDDDKDIKIYIKLDDKKYAEHIKNLRKLSLAKKIKIKESVNNMFIIIGKKNSELKKSEKELINKVVKEALDIDNLFWMLDTWFTNNEQERTTFMSIIDNCIIKKSYNKNDLAKLCDNINFEIRPFVNFMCKDAVVPSGQKEDFNLDYYYELKKIIDALISNKSTANKFVRFS